jgi:hypothetical protein
MTSHQALVIEVRTVIDVLTVSGLELVDL